jgi:hypothetical protein
LAMSIKDLISGKFLGFGKMAFGPLNLMRWKLSMWEKPL